MPDHHRLPHRGLTGAQRAQYWAEVQDMARGHRALLRSAVTRAVRRRLGPQAGYGTVTAFVTLLVAVLLASTSTVAMGWSELERRHGVSRSSLSRARRKLVPPDGAPSTAALLLRAVRGRLNVNTGEWWVSRWYPGDQLLLEVRGRMRGTLDRGQRKRSPRKVRGRRPVPPPPPVPPAHAECVTPQLGAVLPLSTTPAGPAEPTGQALYHRWKADRARRRRE